MRTTHKLTALIALTITSLAGIQSAAAQANMSLVQHDVVLDAQGRVFGSISAPDAAGIAQPVASASVSIHDLQSSAMARAVTNYTGMFAIANIKPGIYGLAVRSADAVAAHAIRVLPPDAAGPSELNVVAAPVPASEAYKVWKSSVSMSGQPSAGYGLGGYSAPQMVPRAYRNGIVVGPGGTVSGRLTFPAGFQSMQMNGMQIRVIQNGKAVGTYPVSPNGRFQLPSLSPGSYGIIASGRSGFAAAGFQVFAPGNTSTQPRKSPFQLASARMQDEFEIEILPADLLPDTLPPEDGEPGDGEEGALPDPFGMAGAGGGGSFGGGGGGSGGGGGLGGLEGLAAAGIAAGIGASGGGGGGAFAPAPASPAAAPAP